ncbi:MAG: 2'-5' RNA ligase family protein [Actinomycetota bacterium]
MPKARLGVALLLPPAPAAEVDGLRRALGDGALGRIPAHLTLVPPVNVREDRMGEALAVLRGAASAVGAAGLTLALGPPATFLPDNPVLYLGVGGDLDRLRALRDAVFAGPLSRPLTWPWVPHVTLADEADPARIAAALAALADFRLDVEMDRVHLLQEGPGRVWSPIADAGLGPPAVVGRGGLAVELAASELVDPEAGALLAGAGTPRPGAGTPGRPFAVTSRLGGVVVGVAAGATAGATAELTALLVDPAYRRLGIGSHLLAAAGSLAAGRGCVTLGAGPALEAAAAGFLRHRGWAAGEGPPRLRRSL